MNVGDGVAKKPTSSKSPGDDIDEIEVSNDLLLSTQDDPREEIFNSTYTQFATSFKNRKYLQGRAILTPRNETVDELNTYFLSKLEGDVKEYLSSDSISTDDSDVEHANTFYTPEYLNSLKCSGLPNHQLQLKLNAPVILMRNINEKEGLCNGTRLLITRLGERVLEAEILTGTNVGKKILIPRIIMTTADTKCPYKMRRR